MFSPQTGLVLLVFASRGSVMWKLVSISGKTQAHHLPRSPDLTQGSLSLTRPFLSLPPCALPHGGALHSCPVTQWLRVSWGCCSSSELRFLPSTERGAQAGGALGSHPAQSLHEGWQRIAGGNQEWVPLPGEEMGVHCDTLSSELVSWFLVNLVLSEMQFSSKTKGTVWLFVPKELGTWHSALKEGAQWESKSGRASWDAPGLECHIMKIKTSLQHYRSINSYRDLPSALQGRQPGQEHWSY